MSSFKHDVIFPLGCLFWLGVTVAAWPEYKWKALLVFFALPLLAGLKCGAWFVRELPNDLRKGGES